MSRRASDRVTGFAMALALVMPTVWIWFGRGELWLWTLPLAGLLGLFACFAPGRLHRLCSGFHRVTGAFHRLLGRGILIIIFFTCVLPLGLLIRVAGHDPMGRARKAPDQSYWKAAEPRRDGEDAFRDQF